MKFRKSDVLIPFLILFAGCATTYGNRWTETNYHSLQKGISKSQVIQLLGAPREVLRNENKNELLVYESVRAKKKFWTSVMRKWTKRLTIEINSEGKVLDFHQDELYSEDLFFVPPAPSSPTTSNYQGSVNANYAYNPSRY